MASKKCNIVIYIAVFYGEVMGTLKRALEDNIGADNIVLEINSLK